MKLREENQMKFAYYPGCTATQTSIEYDESVRETAQYLGIDLEEIPDWTCCGASSGHIINEELALALPCQNLVLANKMSLGIVTPCPACSLRHKVAEYELRKDPDLKARIEADIGEKLDLSQVSKHILEVLYHDVGIEAIQKKVQKSLKGLKAVSYYGCYLVRPSEVTGFDDVENPVALDEVMKALDVDVIDWSYKVECCGASATIPDPEIVKKLSGKIVNASAEAGAEAIIAACPMCHHNLDIYKNQQKNGHSQPMPIFYFSELTALAFGSLHVKEYLAKHMVDSSRLLERLKLL